MSEFINTIDVLGDDAVMDSLIEKSITEFKDDEIGSIGAYAFNLCKLLTYVDLPNATGKSGRQSFGGCTALETVKMPKISDIDMNAFSLCTSLADIDLSNAQFIRQYAFENCNKLKRLKLPKVTRLWSRALFRTGLMCVDIGALEWTEGGICPENPDLVAFIIRNTNVVANLVGGGMFDSTPIASGTGYIYVPRALVDSYKTANNWSTYATQFRAIEDYTVDGTVTGDMREYCESFALDVTELTFIDTNSQTLTTTRVLPGILDEIIWESSDKRVAIVKNGVVTPISDGTAIITVTCGDSSATCAVTVNAGLELTNILYDIGFNSGYLDGGNGTAKSATSDLYTDKFDISKYAGSSINVQLTNVTGTAANSRICYYTTDNTFISSVNGVSGGSGIVNMASTVPNNAAYAAISIAKNNNFSINITIDGGLIGEVEYTS